MKTHINLLPVPFRVRRLVRRRLRAWSMVWGLTLVMGAGVWCVKSMHNDDQLRLLESSERQYAPIARLQGEIDKLEGEVKLLQAQEAVLGGLRVRRSALTLLGLVSQSAQRCNGDVVVEQLTFRTGREPASSGQHVQTLSGGESLLLKGVGADNLAVAQFVVALRDTGAFERVELKSAVREGAATADICSYLLECDL